MTTTSRFLYPYRFSSRGCRIGSDSPRIKLTQRQIHSIRHCCAVWNL